MRNLMIILLLDPNNPCPPNVDCTPGVPFSIWLTVILILTALYLGVKYIKENGNE
jgi:hypothetical protein